MAGPKTFIGVGGKARQVKNIYVGVSGKARKVKRVYVGVGSKARLVYNSAFYCPSGVSEANCVAAYQFKGAASKTEALTDRTGHGWNLTTRGSTVLWDATKGVYAQDDGWSNPYLNSANGGVDSSGKAVSSLAYQNIKSAVIRYYTGWTPTNYEDHPRVELMKAGFSHSCGYLRISQGYVSGTYEQWGADGYHYTNKTSIPYYAAKAAILYPNWAMKNGGVMGASWGYTGSTYNDNIKNQNFIYINGAKATSSLEYVGVDDTWYAGTVNTWASAGVIFDVGAFPVAGDTATFASDCLKVGNTFVKPRLIAASFYSVVLTDAQHKEVYDNMMKI